MGLSFLGRGNGRRGAFTSTIHLIGAALGGAVTGGVLAGVGSVVVLAAWRPWVIGLATVAAFWRSVRGRGPVLLRTCQVPRRPRCRSVSLVFFGWGFLLGCGVATVIPYSAFLVLVATQLTAGFALGCLSGFVFEVTRQAVAIALFMRERSWTGPERLMGLLPRLRTPVRNLNRLWVPVAGAFPILVTAFGR